MLSDAGLVLRGSIVYFRRVIDWLKSLFFLEKPSNGSLKIVDQAVMFSHPSKPTLPNETTCPYEYILGTYGQRHFSKFVDSLKPGLKLKDPVLWDLVLEVMDAVHFGAILVDDVADNSLVRKGKPAAHCIYGPSETINRAYLRILEIINKCLIERPSMVPYVLANLEQIHKGRLPFFPLRCNSEGQA